MRSLIISLFVALALTVQVRGNEVDIHVQCDKPSVELSEHLYGLFFEDINYAADGGLYAELVQNRSFEYYPIEGNDRISEKLVPLYAWEKVEKGSAHCSIKTDRIVPLNRNNQNYLVLKVDDAGDGAGVANTGYDGIHINNGDKYDISFYTRNNNMRRRNPEDEGPLKLTAALELADGTICGSCEFEIGSNDWKKYSGVLTATRTAEEAKLVVTVNKQGTYYFDMISLFPEKTYKGRKNGMRADLGQALEDLSPKFMRFPGGCIAHGCSLQNAYRWKDTVGDVAERRSNWNRWGYHQTYGLGYYEYFQLCEDIGAEALPVLPIGVSCGFNSPYQCVPIEDLGEWIDDCLDLIEFANGPVDSEWGSLRAKMGHPESFSLDYICLGNEEHDRKEMRERFPYFVKAIRAKYPDIKIIGTSGLGSEIPIYDLMTEQKVYSSDEHYYMSPQWFIENQNRFDDFDRSKPKIFVGEYASQGNTLFNAVAEAAFLTGVERNGDMVDMTCYAPLFAHVHHTQWNAANMIWFDKRTVVKTPNYYVQQMFSCNKGDVYLPTSISKPIVKEPETISGAVGVGTWATTIAVESVSVNGKELDPANWNVIDGSFAKDGSSYVQSNLRPQPAVSYGNTVFDGDKITYTVKAKKTGGVEGFLLVFGCKDSDNYYWWNVGGWGNTQHALEEIAGGGKSVLVERRGSIENDRVYTMTVELAPGRIKCYLDGELIHDYEIKPGTISAGASYDKSENEVILKLVNALAEPVDANIYLDGAKKIGKTGGLQIISGVGSDKNSIEMPEKVKTEFSEVSTGKKFKYTLPAMSVQFITVSGK